MTTIHETFGVVRTDGTLEVEHKLEMPPGRVKVLAARAVRSQPTPNLPATTVVTVAGPP